MDEFLELLQSERRTRQLSSDSSLDTPPQSKKPRECDSFGNFPEGECDEGDIIISALNMAEALQKPLEEILKKLEKLDIIEEAVNNLQKSFKKLEGRMETLEDAHTATKRDVEDLKESLNSNEVDKKMTAERIKKLQDNTKSSLAALEKENDELRAKFKLIEDKNLYLEAYSRRENIKFENIPEGESTDKEDVEMVLRTFLETEFGFSDAANVEIQRVHRLGKKKGESPRPILAGFLRYKDCGKILSLGHRLRETNYRMYQDLPIGIVERRRAQMDTFKKANRNSVPAAFSKAQPDKLYIRGKLWPLGMPLEL